MVAVLFPTGPGSQIVIDRAVVLVGRSADCDAVIDFSSRISRRHCVFVQVDADYYVRDLGSMNGVWLNGDRVEKSTKLVQGDHVAIGDVTFQFHANVQPPPRTAVRAQNGGKGMPVLVDESVEPILDVEIIEDSEFLDDVQMIDSVDIIEEIVEVVDEIEIIDEIEVIGDDEVIEDVQIITDVIRRPRRPPRLR